MFTRFKSIGVAACIMALLLALLSSCDKDKMVYNKIEGTWTLTSDPSCTWTFKENNDAIISVDSFKAIQCKYEIEKNTLHIYSPHFSSYNQIGTFFEDNYLSIDYLNKGMLSMSGIIRIYERTENTQYEALYFTIPISYEFRKSN